jgi:hypothetical protein
VSPSLLASNHRQDVSPIDHASTCTLVHQLCRVFRISANPENVAELVRDPLPGACVGLTEYLHAASIHSVAGAIPHGGALRRVDPRPPHFGGDRWGVCYVEVNCDFETTVTTAPVLLDGLRDQRPIRSSDDEVGLDPYVLSVADDPRAEPERVREIDRITGGESVEIQPASQPDRVKLRAMNWLECFPTTSRA